MQAPGLYQDFHHRGMRARTVLCNPVMELSCWERGSIGPSPEGHTTPLPTDSGEADAKPSAMRNEKDFAKVCLNSSLYGLRSTRLKRVCLPVRAHS